MFRSMVGTRRLAPCLVGIGALIAAAGCGSDEENGSSASTGASGSGNCSNGSLTGSYGVRFEGTNKKLGRFASVSLWSFDGKGGLKASEDFTAERSGSKSRKIQGRYEVGRDCRFKLHFGSELVREHDAEGVCVLVAGGKEFSCLDAEEGWVTLGTGTKL